MKKIKIVTVTKFGKTKKAKGTVYGKEKDKYEGKDLLWIERGEDWYALDHYIKNVVDFCVITREDFLNGSLC